MGCSNSNTANVPSNYPPGFKSYIFHGPGRLNISVQINCIMLLFFAERHLFYQQVNIYCDLNKKCHRWMKLVSVQSDPCNPVHGLLGVVLNPDSGFLCHHYGIRVEVFMYKPKYLIRAVGIGIIEKIS